MSLQASPSHGASIRVRRPSGMLDRFEAETCSIEGDAVHATGCWEDPSGRRYDRASYVWPLRRVLEIRWRETAS